MNRTHYWILSLSIVGALCACGGGGDGGGSSSPTPPTGSAPEKPAIYATPTPTAGDYYTYEQTTIYTAPAILGTAIGYVNRIYTGINADGSIAMSTTNSNDAIARRDATLAASGEMKSDVAVAPLREVYIENYKCDYSPAWTAVPMTLSVGQSWDLSSTRTCDGRTYHDTAKGTATGVETVTVRAGTFKALKLSYTSAWVSDLATSVTENTCWRDTATGQNVKCTGTNTYTPRAAGAAGTSYTYNEDLIGYANSMAGAQKPVVERFAGSWWGSYKSPDGVYLSQCSILIYPDASVGGSCGNMEGGWPALVRGTIDASGNMTFTLSSQDGQPIPALSVTRTSMLSFTGTVTLPSGTSLPWSAIHN
jgi:hypothetical protein